MFTENAFISSQEISQWARAEAHSKSGAYDLSHQVESQIKEDSFHFLKDFFLKLSQNMKIRFF